MDTDPFKEYIKAREPAKRDKGYAWQTAIGLQAVDGLKPSEYLEQTALRNIEGEISFSEAIALLQTYYEQNPRDVSDRTEEADKVSVRIAALLSENSFSLTPNEYLSVHRKLFAGIYPHAGCIRDYNITKKEWVLEGASVTYGTATELHATLDYDLSEERKFSYENLSMDEVIQHLAKFVSMLWQIHVFSEGNTRTTAVFLIKYLRSRGFDVTNDVFAENAWYFRNALVRANYSDIKNGIHETTKYLELFLRNLLLNEHHPLRNRTLHISGSFEKTQDAHMTSAELLAKDDFTEKTASYIERLREAVGTWHAFGRSDVQRILSLKPTRSSELLRQMAEHGVIGRVTGYGKGKFRFENEMDEVDVEADITARPDFYAEKLREAVDTWPSFGKLDVRRILGLSTTRSSKLLEQMAECGTIEPASGHGNGQFSFRSRRD